MARSTRPTPCLELSQGEIHAISRALSDQRRFEILKYVAASACMACADLREKFPISAATLSHHLRELESAKLIEVTRRGKFVDTVFCRNAWDAYIAELQKL